MFIIIEWNGSPETAAIILDERGFNKLFANEEEAYEWARRELAFEWKIVEVRRTAARI